MDGVAGRWRWLGSPAFLLAVGVLALNDHVLKDRFSNWWTGKLSDVAGVVVIAVAASVVLGPKRGVVLAGIGFAALKTVPGIAELVSPLLGGVTRRDATDLLAIAVLLPTYAVFRWASSRPAIGELRPAERSHPRVPEDDHRGRSAAGAMVLPILGATMAMFATTATSCSEGPAVDQVIAHEGRFYAGISADEPSTYWASSDDGGRTWTENNEAPPGGIDNRSGRWDPEPLGPSEACWPDGTCFEVRNRRTIVRIAPAGGSRPEFHLTEEDLDEISNSCRSSQLGVLTSMAAPGPGQPVVASLGADGVVVRQPDGTWEQFGVLGAQPPEPSPPAALGWALLGFGPVAALAIGLFARTRWPAWGIAIAVVLLGWVVAVIFTGLAVLLVWNFGYVQLAIGGAICLVSLIVSALVGRSKAFAPKSRAATWGQPPPPAYPPPPPFG